MGPIPITRSGFMNKLIDKEIRKLLRQYTFIIEKLRKNKIIKTGKVVADYGEYVASKKLKLTLVDSPINKGYDATDKKGNKYEIKTRKATTWNTPSNFPVKQSQLRKVKYLIYVELDNKWNVIKLLKIPAGKIKQNKYNRVHVSQDLIREYSVL